MVSVGEERASGGRHRWVDIRVSERADWEIGSMERETPQHIEISLDFGWGITGIKDGYRSERTVLVRHEPQTDPAGTSTRVE